MSAVYAYGKAPRSRIHATAAEVSSPPENAMPTRSPLGSEVKTFAPDVLIFSEPEPVFVTPQH